MKITAVEPSSPLFGVIRPGYNLLSINDQEVIDAIDFHFRVTDSNANLRFIDSKGQPIDFQIGDYSVNELGLTFEDQKVLVCKNNCIFCFVHQQPKGMRRALYIKDEDYRLSFTHGNFITLSNTTEKDIERIIEQRLSPLYVSVHTTDDTLRGEMLKNKRLIPILDQLKHLTKNGITVHTQVVLCPGINDGYFLEKTVSDLAALYPGINSLAVIPVGLTKYRERLPQLRTYTKNEAITIVRDIELKQHAFFKSLGSRFVWLADEFYILADRRFPLHSHYEEMPQFENGVGMAREFMTVFNRHRASLKSLNRKRRALFVTGYSAFPFFQAHLMPYIKTKLRVRVNLEPVRNEFWGDKVTVSGLLTGNDILKFSKKKKSEYDTLVIPPNCLNHDELFLDDLSLSDLQKKLGKPVVVGKYNLAATLKEVFS